MDASYKIQRGIHVHLIQFFMCPEFWVHITGMLRFFSIREGHMVNLNHPLTPPQKAICGWSRNRAKQATQNSAAIRSCT